jgi:nitroreductase
MIGTVLAMVMLMGSCAFADSAVDVILNTGTTQAFTDEAVSAADLETILKAGLSTESAINQQPWFFVAVTNQDVMKEIGGSGMGGFSMPAGGGKPEGAPEGGKPEGMPEGASAGGKTEGAPEGGMPAMPSGGSGAKASLGDSPAAIIIYKNDGSKSPDASFDCGLATQNMVIAASALGYGVKIVSSPTMSLNGTNHDALCEKLGVDPSMQAVAVLLIGKADESTDATSGATTREAFETKTSIIE